MVETKRKKVFSRVEQHLRKTSRQLIKIDTEEQALQYLSDSFRAKLYCDFVGVVFVEDQQFVVKTWSGKVKEICDAFPLRINDCARQLLERSLTNKEAGIVTDSCKLFSTLKSSGVKTWFTVPIKDDLHTFGFCIIGFLNFVPLLDLGYYFDEFGQDVAVAISMTRNREKQLKRIEGIEWVTNNLSIDAPIEESIRAIATRAAKGTDAEFSCLYLYHEEEDSFIFHPPSFGEFRGPEKIKVDFNNAPSGLFPYLEKPGGPQLAIPISLDLKTIAVIHVDRKRDGVFGEEDLNLLRLLGDHIATILENARLYNMERENRNRLRFLLEYQETLVKETAKSEGFNGIISMLGELFGGTVVLFDRFMQPLSHVLLNGSESLIPCFRNEAERAMQKKRNQFVLGDRQAFTFWPVKSGGDLLGYLVVQLSGEGLEEYDQIMIEMARNICSIQFIKQKLVLEATEQTKENFISKLLDQQLENEESILQYANLFMWDPYQSHRVALLSIELQEKEREYCNLLDQQRKRASVWDFIKVFVVDKKKRIMATTFKDQYLFIMPAQNDMDRHWPDFYKNIRQAAKKSGIACDVLAGIGGKTGGLQDYYRSSEQARQALNIVRSRFYDKGYAFFEQLGSYTILHQLDNTQAADLFMDNQLGPLEKYSEGKNTDLIETLRVYLQNNGNANATAEELFIHRSSLLYRLEKIEALLDVDLSDSEARFNLMMAFKLNDMRGRPM